jgi:hypothetical protein
MLIGGCDKENPVSSNAYGCGEPTINDCTGDPCGYFHIYDTEGTFVAEGTSMYYGQVVWNGKDCRGNPVPCGIYTMSSTLKSGGESTAGEMSMIVTDDNGIGVRGERACDSLEAVCEGSFHTTTVQDYAGGYLTSTVGCVCCR